MASNMFSWPDYSSVSVLPSNDPLRNRLWTQEDEDERGFFSRLFAPVMASQQTLFSLTKEISDDGFQLRDLWTATVHGAKYFNPFGNEEEIQPDEIRQVFFGPDTEESNKWLNTVGDLAIGFLYDPLIVAGAFKAVATAAGAGKDAVMAAQALRTAGETVPTALLRAERLSKTAGILDDITNPAGLAYRMARQGATQVLGPLGKGIATRVLGEERAERWGVEIAQNFFNKDAGIDPLLVARRDEMLNSIDVWNAKGYSVTKASEALGGRNAQDLLGEALETMGVLERVRGDEVPKRALNAVEDIYRRVAAEGIDEDLFNQILLRARNLDNEIGAGLVNAGLMDAPTHAAMKDTHLRRIYQAFETPQAYLDRLDSLNLPDNITYATRGNLRRGFEALQESLSKPGGMFTVQDALGLGGKNFSFFTPEGNLDVAKLADDVFNWINSNSEKTINNLLTHVDDVLEGAASPELFKMVANVVSESARRVSPKKLIREMLEPRLEQNGYVWRTIKENTDVLTARQDLPPIVREALGEIVGAAPRIAAEMDEVGILLETRKFLQEIAGVRRPTEEQVDTLKKLRDGTLPRNPQGEDMLNLKETLKLSDGELASVIDNPSTLGAGIPLNLAKGSRWASVEKAPKLGHTVMVPNTKSYGDVAGMWVSPGTAMLLRHLEGVGDIASGAPSVLMKLGEKLAGFTSLFKAMKTVLDPVAQFRNFMGNAILMDMSGTSPVKGDLYIKAINELKNWATKGEVGRYLQLATEANLGLFTNTFSAAELRIMARKLVDINPKEWDTAIMRVYESIQQTGANVVNVAGSIFDFNEKLFKLSTFIDRVDRMEAAVAKAGKLLTQEVRRNIARQAANISQQALFNYNDVPYMVEFARKYGIVPFITFPFKAVPFAADTLFTRPLRVLKYSKGLDVWNDAWSGGPEQTAREIDGLPRYIRDSMVLKMPFNDAYDRPLYVDLSYFLPWGATKDVIDTFMPTEHRGGGFVGFREGMMTPPIMTLIDAFRRGEDANGRRLTSPTRTAAENFEALGAFLWQFMAPPSAVGGQRANSVGRALQAFARTDPEPIVWMDALGQGLRAIGPMEESIFASDAGFIPQSQAQATGIRGAVSGLLFGGATASDPNQAAYQEAAARKQILTDSYKMISQISSNPSLSILEKNIRIAKIRGELEARLAKK